METGLCALLGTIRPGRPGSDDLSGLGLRRALLAVPRPEQKCACKVRPQGLWPQGSGLCGLTVATGGSAIRREAQPRTVTDATVKPHSSTIHGHTRVDNYYWLNDKTDPEVIAAVYSFSAWR